MHVLIDILYEIMYWLFGMLMVFTHGFRVSGARHVPQSGPVLLIANHQSYFDVVPLGLAARRRIYYLAKLPLFRSNLLAGIMRIFGHVPVDNSGFSRSSFAGILDYFNQGKMVLVFPEGERCWDGKLNELKPGIALVIKKAKVTIVPIGVAGVFETWSRFRKWPILAPPFLSWSRARMAAVVGEPLDGALLAGMPRDEMMNVLTMALAKVVAQAARLRGNACISRDM